MHQHEYEHLPAAKLGQSSITNQSPQDARCLGCKVARTTALKAALNTVAKVAAHTEPSWTLKLPGIAPEPRGSRATALGDTV